MQNITFSFKLLFVILTGLLAGCAASKMPDSLMASNDFSLSDIKANLSRNKNIRKFPENDKIRDLGIAKPEERNLYGVVMTKELTLAYQKYVTGEIDSALDELAKLDKNRGITDKQSWQSIFLKIQLLTNKGLAQDALALADECRSKELKVFGSNLNCTSLEGEVYVWLENYEKAENSFLSVLQPIGGWDLPSDFAQYPTNIDKLVLAATAQIRAMTGLSGIYYFTGDYSESFYWIKQAKKRLDNALALVNHQFYGNFFKPHVDLYYGAGTVMTLYAANVLATNDDSAQADRYFDKAIEYYEILGFRRGIAYTRTARSYSYLHSGRNDIALEASEAAITYARQYGFLDLVWRIEVERGIYYFDTGNLSDAEISLRAAQQTIRLISNTLASDLSKTHFGAGKDEITKYLVKIDLLKNDIQGLFSDLEEGRSRVFLDLYSGAIISSYENPILSRIKNIDENLLKLFVKAGSSVGMNDASGELADLRLKRQLLVDELKKESPRLSSAISIWQTSIKEVQHNLRNGEQIIYFFFAGEGQKLHYIEITRDEYQRKETNLTSAQIQDTLNQLYDLIGINNNKSANRGLIFKRQRSAENSSNYLAEELAENLRDYMGLKNNQNARHTYIVPDGVLNFVPWGIFDLQSSISILTSASLLNFDGSNYRNGKAVIVGNPNFGGELVQLEGAETEAIYIADMYKTKALLNSDATLANIRSELENGGSVLHLATHGSYNKESPLDSVIFLSKDDRPAPLTAREIYRAPLKANLIVLSACETGLGKSISGDELLGLNRSFLLGGANSILSSLWGVEDQGTTEFMKVFHRHAKDGKYSEGYKAARDTLKKQGYPPIIYAAFILTGKDIRN